MKLKSELMSDLPSSKLKKVKAKAIAEIDDGYNLGKNRMCYFVYNSIDISFPQGMN